MEGLLYLSEKPWRRVRFADIPGQQQCVEVLVEEAFVKGRALRK